MAISVGLFLLSPWISVEIFNKPDLERHLKILSFALMPFSLRYIYGGVLRSLKKTRQALLIEKVIIYSIGLIAIFSLGMTHGLEGLFIGFTFGCYLSVVFGMSFVGRYLPDAKTSTKISLRMLLGSSLPLLFVAVSTQLIGQVSTLVLGVTASAGEVGVYNIVLKVSVVMALILTAVNTIVSTNISELYALKEKRKLEALLGKTSSLGFLLALPLFLMMFLFPDFILGLFGEEFVIGTSALRILSVGMLINVTVGPTLFILAMTGFEKSLAKAVGFSLVVNVALGTLLIPRYGVSGASLATSISLVLSNIAMLLLVKKHLGVWSLPFKYISLWVKNIRKRK